MGDYTLMHRELPIAELSIDEPTGVLLNVISVLNKDRLPVGTAVDGNPDSNRIRNWWFRRSIPANDFVKSGLLLRLKYEYKEARGHGLHWNRPT